MISIFGLMPFIGRRMLPPNNQVKATCLALRGPVIAGPVTRAG